MRLRVLDLNTPWFWFTVFYYGKRYGKPSLEATVWSPHSWKRFWFNCWQREAIPQEGGGYAEVYGVNRLVLNVAELEQKLVEETAKCNRQYEQNTRQIVQIAELEQELAEYRIDPEPEWRYRKELEQELEGSVSASRTLEFTINRLVLNVAELEQQLVEEIDKCNRQYEQNARQIVQVAELEQTVERLTADNANLSRERKAAVENLRQETQFHMKEAGRLTRELELWRAHFSGLILDYGSVGGILTRTTAGELIAKELSDKRPTPEE